MIEPQAIREFAAKLQYFHSPDEVDVVLHAAANALERQGAALTVAVSELRRLSWEGSSVNYPVRIALNQIRELGVDWMAPEYASKLEARDDG